MNLLASRQEDQFRELQSSITAKLTEAIRDQISTLPRWPTSMERTQQQLRTNSIAITISRYKQPEKSALRRIGAPMNDSGSDQDSFADKCAADYAIQLAELEEVQWRSLWFPLMDDREEQIAIAELKTFDWILRKPQGIQRTWKCFIEWLEHGGAIYWINGKAGSGKSTLMKYLKNHRRVKETLKSWAAGTPLIIASFFFRYNGNALQKTQEGLFRSLLYQALENHRELIPIVLSEAIDVPMNELTNYWTVPRLKRAFRKLIEQKEVPLRICLLVDGLDEYAGDHSEIAEAFQYSSNFAHTKVCVSSRPLLSFDRAFKDFLGLRLEDLTFDDIQAYVKSKFQDDERFKELEIEEPGLAPNLALQVVKKASGVFLWVKLVVHSLLEGLQNFDRGIDLERRLNELPEDLNNLYWHMLDQVRPAWYLEEGYKLLVLVHTAVMPLTLLQLAFVEIEAPAAEVAMANMSIERQNALCKSMAGRIKSRCLGLLEVTDITCMDEKYRRVQFLHKSVNDFMETPKMRKKVQDCLSKEEKFIPEIAIIQALSIELRTATSRLRKEQFCEGDGLTREAWFDEVRPIMFEAVRYAAIAEAKTPTSRKNYTPLITEIEGMTTNLWNSVNFRAPEEISGSLHWSVAPRKPGATSIEIKGMTRNLWNSVNFRTSEEISGSPHWSFVPRKPGATSVETFSLVPKRKPNASQVSEPKDDAADTDTPVGHMIGPVIFDDNGPFITTPLRPRILRRVRFANLPTPQCFPGEGDDDERPRRPWSASHTSGSLAKLAGINIMTNFGFENVVRQLGLEEYANERFGSKVENKNGSQTFKMGTQSSENPLESATRARKEKKSFSSRLKSSLCLMKRF